MFLSYFDFFFSETKFSKSKIDTFFLRPIFPKPQLFSETKFCETKTETFFPGPNFLKPKLRHFFRDQIFRNRHFFPPKTKFSKTETKTLQKLSKVSKPRSFEIKMSISAPKRTRSRENSPELLTT